MASVSCAVEYRITSGKIAKQLDRAAYADGPPLSLIMQGLDLTPVSTEAYDGPTPDDPENFRDFINHHWTRVRSKYGASYMFLSRRMFSTQSLEQALLTGSRPPDLTPENIDTTFPTFCCFTDGEIHVTLEYWGRPEGHPDVRVTPLRRAPEGSVSFEFRAK